MKNTLCVSLLALAISSVSLQAQNSNAVSLFDGKTLNGWIDQENSAGNIGGGDIKDLDGFAKKLTDKSDAVSKFLFSKLEETNQTLLAEFVSGANTNAKAIRNALGKNLNKIISDGAIYDATVFKDVHLRPETKSLLDKNPNGFDLIRLNKLLLEDAYPDDLEKGSDVGWEVKDGVIASTGAGRGTLYTTGDYGHFRLTFLMRHVSGKPDHQACVLIFCTRPNGEKPLDALGGIQFQVPNGGHWDYRPRHNNGGGKEFTNMLKPKFDVHDWSRIEIVADAATGVAKMAVAQPLGTNAVEVLDFSDPTAGKVGPIALQMHNGGLFDEYKDIKIEVNPSGDELLSVKSSANSP
jgi:hypothetical protein